MNELLPARDFSERMASIKFEDENLVIISSKDAISMKEWRDHLIKNWDKVLAFLVHSFLMVTFYRPTPPVDVLDFKRGP